MTHEQPDAEARAGWRLSGWSGRKTASTAALILVTTPFCVHLNRGASRQTLITEAGYVRPHEHEVISGGDCGGSSFHEEYDQVHEQIGGRVSYRYEDRDGLNAAASGSVVHGRVADRETDTQSTPRFDEYAFFSLAGDFGYDWENTGFTFGGGFSVDTEGNGFPLLVTEARLGYLPVAWLEVGSRVGTPFDGRALYAGVGFSSGPVRGHVGGAYLADPLTDVWFGDLELAEDEDECCGAYADLEWRFLDRFGLTIGGALPGAPRLRVGFLVDW